MLYYKKLEQSSSIAVWGLGIEMVRDGFLTS